MCICAHKHNHVPYQIAQCQCATIWSCTTLDLNYSASTTGGRKHSVFAVRYMGDETPPPGHPKAARIIKPFC